MKSKVNETIPLLSKENTLSPLGEKIFLDRYARKDMTKITLKKGDTVIVCTDLTTGQREIGVILHRADDRLTVELRDGTTVERTIEHIDKPLETQPTQMVERVAQALATVESPEKQAKWVENFRWLLTDWKFVPGGRILAGAGTDQNLTYFNCFVVPSPHDSRGGIMTTLTQMTEIMSRGGGVGINISSLRPQHAYVKGVNGRSSGSVSWGGLYSFVTGLVEQAGSRRGALMLILNVWHPDVLEFINSKRVAGQITNANISVGITDDFMAAVKADADWDLVFPDTGESDYDDCWDGNLVAWRAAGKPIIRHKTVKAREVWQNIIESAWASAEPGLWFMDRANKMSNSGYYPEGNLISTNPCITGDTRIYTDAGLVQARDLFNDETKINVVTDGRFGLENTLTSATYVFMTGIKQVYRLQTQEGYYLRATADHKLMTPQGWVKLKDLKPGKKVHILNRKGGGFGYLGSLEEGRVLGWLVGDGTIKNDRAVLSFFGDEKEELAPIFAEYVSELVEPITVRNRTYPVGVVHVSGRNEARVQSGRLRKIAHKYGLTDNKHQVPEVVFQGNENMQRGFLQGLFTADGCFLDGGDKGGSVRLAASHLELLEGIQLLLGNFGIASRIYRNRRKAGYRQLPDSKGSLKSYWCQAQHELVITKQNICLFADEIGFLMSYKQNALTGYIERYKRGPYSEYFTATVESVEEDGVAEEVFDLTEPITHSFVANNFVLHNCGEQPLAAWSVCNLGALNLSQFIKRDDVDWTNLAKAVRYAVRFLDNVIDNTPYFFDENANQQQAERRVGLGTMGLAELLIRLKIRYGSPESIQFLDKLYHFIAQEAYLASADYALEKGIFAKFDPEKFLQSGFMKAMPEEVRVAVALKGLRNVTLLTQAPTGTTGTMIGTSTGIEPYYFWSYFRKSRLGMHEEKVNVAAEWQEANPNQPLPDYFVTAMDLAPEDHVRVQAAIQRWVDSSISKTCNVPHTYTVDQVRDLYELMYDLGCKGGTIYRDGSRNEQVLHLDDQTDDQTNEADIARPVKAIEQPEPIEPIKQTPLPPEVKARVRPTIMHGKTYRKHTPVGTAYITINANGDGDQAPFEIFINISKVGSDVAADAEGLGRIISLILRMPGPLTPYERAQDVIAQLRGIGSGQQQGFGKQRVMSLSDAVAQALAEHIGFHPNADLPGLPDEEDEDIAFEMNFSTPKGDICPTCGNAALMMIEGCKKCYSCGYSEC